MMIISADDNNNKPATPFCTLLPLPLGIFVFAFGFAALSSLTEWRLQCCAVEVAGMEQW